MGAYKYTYTRYDMAEREERRTGFVMVADFIIREKRAQREQWRLGAGNGGSRKIWGGILLLFIIIIYASARIASGTVIILH